METTAINPENWIDKYSDYLFNYTIVRVNDREVTNDIISETFLAALRSLKNSVSAATSAKCCWSTDRRNMSPSRM